MKYVVLFNAKSGTALNLGLSHDQLLSQLHAGGLDVELDSGEDALSDKVARAVSSDANIVVSAGGDGTATAIAQAIVGTSKTLAILPLGTANMLARDLGIPVTLEAAIAQLADMQAIEIDAGEVNGRLFLHNVVVGTIPSIAAAREKVRGGSIWDLLGFFRYMVRRLSNSRQTAIAIASRDTNDRVERVHAIAVANNSYDEGWGKLFTRSSLNAGTLTLYVLRRLSFVHALRLWFEMATGRWLGDDALIVETVRSVTLRSKRPRLSVMIDGEVDALETPLNFRIREKALRVLVPRVVPSTSAQS